MAVRAGTVLLVALSLAAAPAEAAADELVGTLSPGEHAFWDGPYSHSAFVPSSELCDVAGPCWAYRLRVERGARRLRVAIDWPSSEDVYALELRDPGGRVVATDPHVLHFSHELFVLRPAAGVWTVRVIPQYVTRSAFRARARLERRPRPPRRRRRLLLPNLQPNAPWNFSFVAPLGPYTQIPADFGGFRPLSCSPDETVIGGARRCLRFSVGPMNVGAGPYEAQFDAASARPNSEGVMEGPVTQRIFRRDGSYVDRSAGTFIFHETHAHFHVQNMLAYELLRVVDARRGTLEPTGVGRKASFCTLDLMIADFERFRSEPARYSDEDVCFRPPDSDTTVVMGVTPGWADVYTWDLPDQYVEFGDNGPDRYVVQAVVDGGNTIRESRDDDNVGYAYIEVVGDMVRLIERGIGASPWDRRKKVLPLEP